MKPLRLMKSLEPINNYGLSYSPDHRVFAIRDRGHCRDRYVLHAFRMLYANQGFYAWGQGSTQLGRWRLLRRRFNEFPFPIPPISEQSVIVRFLHHADRRIKRYIHAKQKLIELLEEQKQAIIHLAVTRGLDPNVRLKPSGLEWLGDVPEHWGVGRIKTEMQNLNTRRVPLSALDRGKMMGRQYDYYGASGVIDKVDDYLFDDELLLIAEDGANLVLRNLPLAIIARGKFWVNNHAHILNPDNSRLVIENNHRDSELCYRSGVQTLLWTEERRPDGDRLYPARDVRILRQPEAGSGAL